jgi:hypothetical protein
VTAPTHDGHDDDLRYPFHDDAAETVPVSELMKQVPARADDPELAPLRIDVSIAVVIAAWLGSIATSASEAWPGSRLIINFGLIAAVMLLIRWTRKR